ncbi:MAG: multiheme c-type cytochrome [Planctomycetota bacterium]
MTQEPARPSSRPRYRPVVGPRLKKLLAVIFLLFAILAVNSVYLVVIRAAGEMSGESYENLFYLWMILVHLVLGLLIVVPVIVFGIVHIRNASNRPNRRAVRVGYALFASAIILFVTGFILIFGVHPTVQRVSYWGHVIAPLAAVWLFVLHRLAGRRIKWKVGMTWGAVATGFAVIMLIVQAQDPRAWNQQGNPRGEEYFLPSLARTSTGQFISADVLENNEYCLECHADVHASWANSVHRFSSFNNPPYLASVLETRQVMNDRDGSVQGARFCAGCHDPVPFFSGAFDDPKFDDPNYDLSADSMAQAGITCTVCHSISHVNTPLVGVADYTIDEPIHYPFTFSENKMLRWVNRQLVKAKPEFHKKTFLKPLHSTAEFCGTCHKVHLPEFLNDYKWLRGQNHYDAWLLSGVSGHGVSSFYYPPKAETDCNGCHMPLMASNEFGAQFRDDSGVLKVHDHMFPSANTAMAQLVGMEDADAVIDAHREFNEGVMRIDIFGVKTGGSIDGDLIAPLRPTVPALVPGETYLLETVVRTMKMGHMFTQGTSDSNEVWVDITVRSGDRVIGRSGGQRESDNEVDPWSHFINSFVIDREGNRISRRNAQDIFTALYNNQLPPGAADVIHYKLRVPEDVVEPITVDVALQYRKFDTELMRFVMSNDNYVNTLPIMTMAEDTLTFPISPGDVREVEPPAIETWMRWNDYGIGLLRKGDTGELRQAEAAFSEVEALGRPDGPLNIARVYINEGRVTDDAPAALQRALEFDPPVYAWSYLWFAGLVDQQNGRLDEAIAKFEQILEGGFEQAAGRSFDFTRDYRLLNELGSTVYDRAKQERGAALRSSRETMLNRARGLFEATLAIDSENVRAHYNLRQICTELGDLEQAEVHAELHRKYKPDDNAADQAIAAARRKYPAANKAAEDIVIYDLQRPGAYGLDEDAEEVAKLDS